REPVLGSRRAAVDRRALENAGLLEFDEPRRQGRGRDRAERLRELAEADRPFVRRPDDGDGPAPLEEGRRTAALLWHGLAATAAHARRVPARARARAPRRASSPGGSSSRTSRPRGRRRDRPGSARE